MATALRTKDVYQKELDQRVLFVADLMVGKTKKHQTYGEFFETISFRVENMNQVVNGTRHFTVYNCFLLCEVHGVSEAWLLRGVGEVYGQANLIEKIQRLEDTEARHEHRITVLENLVGKKSGKKQG